MELQNPSHDVPELNNFNQSPDLQGLRMGKGRSSGGLSTSPDGRRTQGFGTDCMVKFGNENCNFQQEVLTFSQNCFNDWRIRPVFSAVGSNKTVRTKHISTKTIWTKPIRGSAYHPVC